MYKKDAVVNSSTSYMMWYYSFTSKWGKKWSWVGTLKWSKMA